MTRICRCVGVLVAVLLSAPSFSGPTDPAHDIRLLVAPHPELMELYEPGGYRSIWLETDGSLRDGGRDALRLLEYASDDGLDPKDYAASIAPLRLGEERLWPPAEVATLDVALSQGLLRYVRDLHIGRVDPRAIGFELNVPRSGHQFATLLRDALARKQLVATVYAWRPRDPQYAALAVELARYRTLARRDAAPLPAVARVRPGATYAAVPALWERLSQLGDTAHDRAAPQGMEYSGDVVDAVRRFQQRHGLEPDGVLGRQTFAALAVPLSWRVRQIELAMERLRWLPHQAGERLIVVNIPMFRLFAWDTSPRTGVPAFTTGVIVGRAVSTQTPVFAASLTEVIFRPYWNVPRSIVRQEVLPALAKDPAYFDKHDMELVAGESDQSPVVAASPENIARLRTGQLRLRQRPGPGNSLGRIKFSFPNENDVYMHATPAQALFARNRRDFSHGCVRVEDPVGLAEWVLRVDQRWDRASIVASMDAASSSRTSVRPPISVMLLYTTAAKRFDTGDLVFADDIYGHDPRLDAALRARRP